MEIKQLMQEYFERPEVNKLISEYIQAKDLSY